MTEINTNANTQLLGDVAAAANYADMLTPAQRIASLRQLLAAAQARDIPNLTLAVIAPGDITEPTWEQITRGVRFALACARAED